MPHVVYVPFTGFRVREEEMLALGPKQAFPPRPSGIKTLASVYIA